MNESLREKPPTSIKELLRTRLNESRDVGFITYCLVAQKEIPPGTQTDFKREGFGILTPEIIKTDLQKGALWIGKQLSDNRDTVPAMDPQLVLASYKRMFKRYSRDLAEARRTPKSRLSELIRQFPELKNDKLLSDHWPNIFLFMRDDKAFIRYSITHLRATILGFAQAALHFGDKTVGDNALELQGRFRDNNRADPLKLAGLIKNRQ